jgi:transcription elongation factor Elf1
MDNVIPLTPKDYDSYFNWWVLCLSCLHRYVATVPASAPIFALECPRCGDCKSFPSHVPKDWSDARIERESKK